MMMILKTNKIENATRKQTNCLHPSAPPRPADDCDDDDIKQTNKQIATRKHHLLLLVLVDDIGIDVKNASVVVIFVKRTNQQMHNKTKQK